MGVVRVFVLSERSASPWAFLVRALASEGFFLLPESRAALPFVTGIPTCDSHLHLFYQLVG